LLQIYRLVYGERISEIDLHLAKLLVRLE